MLDELIEAWRTHQRVHELLLTAIPDEGLAATLSSRGGRTVARQFAHLHTQRSRVLEAKGGRDLARELHRFETRDEPSGEELLGALTSSGEAYALFLRQAGEEERPTRGLKKGIVVLTAYLISHESHHRGNVLLTLKQTGHRIEKRILYQIWDWQRI